MGARIRLIEDNPQHRCLAAGAEGYIEKPKNPETFASDIEGFLPTAPDAGN